MENQQVIDALNKQLANWNVLYTKFHNYHWYVTGTDFFTLHEKFEEFYTEAAGYIDEIAERILTIEGKPLATLKEYFETATIQEASSSEDSRQMVESIVKDFQLIINESNELIDVAGNAGDEPTVDIFVEMQSSIQKHKWMLNAYLR